MTRSIVVALALLVLTSCGGGSSAPSTFQIGGTVSGLANGASLTLSDNGTDSLTVNTNGMFTFGVQLGSGATYSVAVSAQPSTQLCSVSGSTGTVTSASVCPVAVSCVGPFVGGGTVTGLSSGLQLGVPDNGADPSTITADG